MEDEEAAQGPALEGYQSHDNAEADAGEDENYTDAGEEGEEKQDKADEKDSTADEKANAGDAKSQVSSSSREDTPDPVILRLKRANGKLRKQLKEMTRLMDIDIRRKALKKGKDVLKNVDKSQDPDQIAEKLVAAERKIKVYQKKNKQLQKLVGRTKPEELAKLQNLIHEQELKIKAMVEEKRMMKKERRQIMKAMDTLNEESSGFPDQLRKLENEVRLYKEKCKKYVKKFEDQERSSRKQRDHMTHMEERLRKYQLKLKSRRSAATEESSSSDSKNAIEKLGKKLAQAKETLQSEKKKLSRIIKGNEKNLKKKDKEIEKMKTELQEKNDQLRHQATRLKKDMQEKFKMKERELLAKIKEAQHDFSLTLREKENEIRLQSARIKELQKVLPSGQIVPLSNTFTGKGPRTSNISHGRKPSKLPSYRKVKSQGQETKKTKDKEKAAKIAQDEAVNPKIKTKSESGPSAEENGGQEGELGIPADDDGFDLREDDEEKMGGEAAKKDDGAEVLNKEGAGKPAGDSNSSLDMDPTAGDSYGEDDFA